MLEMERMKALNGKALIIQRVMRGYKHRYGPKIRCIYLFHVRLRLRFLTPPVGDNS